MTAYSLTPVDAQDRRHGARVESFTAADLLVANQKLRTENDVLRARLVSAQREADRWAGEHALRLTVHERLDKAARVFSVLSFVFPELRDLLGRARKDIWP